MKFNIKAFGGISAVIAVCVLLTACVQDPESAYDSTDPSVPSAESTSFEPEADPSSSDIPAEQSSEIISSEAESSEQSMSEQPPINSDDIVSAEPPTTASIGLPSEANALSATSSALALPVMSATECAYYPSVEGDILTQINDLRASMGLSSLQTKSSLTAGARIRAKEMFDYDCFAHERPDGSTWDTVFYKEVPLSGCSGVGENLVKIENVLPKADDIMELWRTSPTHYENIIKTEYTHIGICVYYGVYDEKGPCLYAVTEFGIFE